MFDTIEQILNQLRAGEDGRSEFKEVRFGDRGVLAPNTQELAGELVAFANAEGGAVFLGVDDPGTVRGIPPEQVDTVEPWLLNVAPHNCDPPIRLVIRKTLLPGAEGDEEHVLLAEVPRGLYVHRTSSGRYYTRIGSTKQDLTGGSPQYDIAHRDYAIAGSKIRLFLFADRLELYSPGKLPNTITIDDMAYRTFTRNQLLVSFLSRIRSKRTGQVFLESRGEGVRKILEDGEAHSGRRPKYELFGHELRLTLWAK